MRISKPRSCMNYRAFIIKVVETLQYHDVLFIEISNTIKCNFINIFFPEIED